MRLQIVLMAAAAALSAGAANAASVEIRDAAARVTVVPQDRTDVRVEMVRINPELPLRVSVSGDRTVIDGDLDRRIQDCDDMDDKANVRVRGVGRVKYDQLPQVVIYTPRNVDVSAGGAVQGSIGRSANLRLKNSGCGAWTIADVAGTAEVHQSGAGDVRMGAADKLDVRLSGAATIHATRVREDFDAHLSGAGGVNVDQMSGDMDARVSGVGHVRVADGQARLVRASVSGIGQVNFGGEARDLDASISGLGSIRVKEVTGSISKSVSGGGSVRVGNR